MKPNYLVRTCVSALLLALPGAGQRTATYTFPNSLYQGDVHMQTNSGVNPLDGPKIGPSPNASAYDWWYFDVVSATTNASFTCTFFLNRGGFTGTSETNSSNLVQAWVTFPNGTAVQTSLYVDENEKVTVTTVGDGSSGDWKGSGASYTGSPDLKLYTVRLTGSSDFEGTIVFNSAAPAHYPCNKNEPYSDEFICPHVGWANAIPDSNAIVDLTVSGEKLAFTGYGYHDKNWGAINFADAVKSWYWGHGRLGPYSIVWFDALGTDGNEYVSSYVAEHGKIIASNCTAGSLKVRPFGGDDTYPPNATSSIPGGYTMSYDLAERGTLDVIFTVGIESFSMPTYNRFVGTLEGGINGAQNLKGQALCEQFAF